MAKRTLNEIVKIDDLALASIFEYYKQYDNETINLCYGEAQRRKLHLSEKQQSKLKEFAMRDGFNDMEQSITDFLQKNNFSSYEELRTSDTSKFKQAIIEEQKRAEGITQRYPALKTIANVYQIFAVIVGLVAIVITFMLISQGGSGGIMIGLVALVIGALIVLGLLAVSESIKVLIDIEYNIRQAANKK